MWKNIDRTLGVRDHITLHLHANHFTAACRGLLVSVLISISEKRVVAISRFVPFILLFPITQQDTYNKFLILLLSFSEARYFASLSLTSVYPPFRRVCSTSPCINRPAHLLGFECLSFLFLAYRVLPLPIA